MAAVREIVILIADLYLADGDSSRSSSAGPVATPSLSGLEEAVRFGQRSALQSEGGWPRGDSCWAQGAGDRPKGASDRPQGDDGWRPWLSRLIGRDDLARAAPAAVAAPATVAVQEPTGGTVWIATPIHLIAGLTSLHLDFRGLLRLPREDLAQLAQDFTKAFGDSEFQLSLAQSGALILRTRDTVKSVTTEPTRALVNDLEASLPAGPDAAVLKRLGAEMEMWLHSHPINDARARRGELPISTLWLWGGGPALTSAQQQLRGASLAPEAPPPAQTPSTRQIHPAAAATQPTVAFGSDPYLVGLCRLAGIPLHALPERLPETTEFPAAERLVLVAQLTPLLAANPNWTLFDALAQIDRAFIAPAMAQLRRGNISSVLVVANDHELHVRRHDHLKFWRRRPDSALSALRGLG
jgi:hypothetical protein